MTGRARSPPCSRGSSRTWCPADIDAWYATATDPDATRTFLKWAIASRAMPCLDVPARRHAERAPISQHRRLALIHRFLTDKRIELRARVAGCLLLLHAQPVSRLARLTLDDIITGDDGQVFIRLGDPPTPVPEPFAAMLTELAANRVNMNTAANPGCQWLFPGQRVGQPLMPIGLRRQLHELGIPAP
jgi:integrase